MAAGLCTDSSREGYQAAASCKQGRAVGKRPAGRHSPVGKDGQTRLRVASKAKGAERAAANKLFRVQGPSGEEESVLVDSQKGKLRGVARNSPATSSPVDGVRVWAVGLGSDRWDKVLSRPYLAMHSSEPQEQGASQQASTLSPETVASQSYAASSCCLRLFLTRQHPVFANNAHLTQLTCSLWCCWTGSFLAADC